MTHQLLLRLKEFITESKIWENPSHIANKFETFRVKRKSFSFNSGGLWREWEHSINRVITEQAKRFSHFAFSSDLISLLSLPSSPLHCCWHDCEMCVGPHSAGWNESLQALFANSRHDLRPAWLGVKSEFIYSNFRLFTAINCHS